MTWSRIFGELVCSLYPSPERVQPVVFAEYAGYPAKNSPVTIYARRMGDLPMPWRTVAEGDVVPGYTGIYGFDPTITYSRPDYRHVGRSLNIVLADGHVAVVPLTQWLATPPPGGFKETARWLHACYTPSTSNSPN